MKRALTIAVAVLAAGTAFGQQQDDSSPLGTRPEILQVRPAVPQVRPAIPQVKPPTPNVFRIRDRSNEQRPWNYWALQRIAKEKAEKAAATRGPSVTTSPGRTSDGLIEGTQVRATGNRALDSLLVNELRRRGVYQDPPDPVEPIRVQLPDGSTRLMDPSDPGLSAANLPVGTVVESTWSDGSVHRGVVIEHTYVKGTAGFVGSRWVGSGECRRLVTYYRNVLTDSRNMLAKQLPCGKYRKTSVVEPERTEPPQPDTGRYSWSDRDRYRGVPVITGVEAASLTGSSPTPPAYEPREPANGFERACVLLVADHADAAAAALREYLESEPDDVVATRLLGVAMIEAGRIDDGVAMVMLAYRTDPMLPYTPLEGELFGPKRLRRILLLAVRQANRADLASGWVTVASLMQGEGRPTHALRMIQRAEALGLDAGLASEFRAALTPGG